MLLLPFRVLWSKDSPVCLWVTSVRHVSPLSSVRSLALLPFWVVKASYSLSSYAGRDLPSRATLFKYHPVKLVVCYLPSWACLFPRSAPKSLKQTSHTSIPGTTKISRQTVYEPSEPRLTQTSWYLEQTLCRKVAHSFFLHLWVPSSCIYFKCIYL